MTKRKKGSTPEEKVSPDQKKALRSLRGCGLSLDPALDLDNSLPSSSNSQTSLTSSTAPASNDSSPSTDPDKTLACFSSDYESSIYSLMATIDIQTTSYEKFISDCGSDTDKALRILFYATQQNAIILKQNQDLIAKLDNLTSLLAQKTKAEEPSPLSIVSQMMRFEDERRIQEEKKANLVIFGLKESTTTSDTEVVKELFQTCGADPNCVQNVFRMGKKATPPQGATPRTAPFLLKVITNSVVEKRKVMSTYYRKIDQIPSFSQSKSTQYNTYLRDDWSPLQLQTHRDLAMQRNEKNAALPQGAPKWSVRNFRLVPPRSSSPQGGTASHDQMDS